ncbi:MAG: hypothetical protein RMI49_05165 [Candidatus Caldarchaeum sp.]|nr:hypothetical protein [Candidatus Caldarchaeum sp.]
MAEKKEERKEEVEVVPTGAKILAVVMIPTVAALNYVGGVIVELLKAPIWGDTWATMLGTLVSGFWVGSIGGFLYNIIMAFTLWGLPNWVWGFANVVIAGITVLCVKMGWNNLRRPLTLVPAFLLFGFVYPIFTTSVHILLFGGGPIWKPLPAAIYAATLSSTGNFVLANYIQSISTEIPDKIISFVVALALASRVPRRFVLLRK